MKIQLVHLEIRKDKEVDLGKISDSDDLGRVAESIIGKRDTENMLILCLDTKSNIIGQDRAALYDGKSGKKIQKYPSSDGGIITGENK